MYPWIPELLGRWRREGRRPPSSVGREFLALPPGPLQDLIELEIERILERDIARISLITAGWSFAAVSAAGVAIFLCGVSWEDALWCIFPALAILIALWLVFQRALAQDSRRLSALLTVLPEFEDPAYLGALLPLLPCHLADWRRPLKSRPNPQVEEHVLTLLPRLEPRHADQWGARDWSSFRTVLRTPHGSARLAMEALHAGRRMGSGEILSALRPLAVSPVSVLRILAVGDTDCEYIQNAALVAVRDIEAKLAGERKAAMLLRASHVSKTSRDDELVRSAPLYEATPREQLVRAASSQWAAHQERTRVSNDDQRE